MSETQRCEMCDWPLAESADRGCVPGNCSYRPIEGTVGYLVAEDRRRQLADGANAKPQPPADRVKRIDTEGRDVTDLPGLWDESDTFIKPTEGATAEPACKHCGVPKSAHGKGFYGRRFCADEETLFEPAEVALAAQASAPQEQLSTRIKKARSVVAGLHSGRVQIRMCIPPQADDTDMFVCRVLDEAEQRIAALEESLGDFVNGYINKCVDGRLTMNVSVASYKKAEKLLDAALAATEGDTQ